MAPTELYALNNQLPTTHFSIHNSYFILSSLSAIFRAFMRSPEKLAREKIEFTESTKLENTIRANLAELVYGP
jgi:hypothetical protein